MSVRKLTVGLIAAVMGGAWSTNVAAQQGQYSDRESWAADAHLPPVDPLAFDPDYRWFEPVYDMDLADMKPEKRAPTGWFGTYDRLHWYGSRPNDLIGGGTVGENKVDGGWGHRYEVGYMLPHKDHGWQFTYTEMDITEFDTIRHVAGNVFVDDLDGRATQNDFGLIVPNVPYGFQGTGSIAVEGMPRFGDNFSYDFSFIDENNAVNVVRYDSFELNKTWRLTPYHYGGILEPMAGVRYIKLDDYFNTAVFDGTTTLIGDTVFLTDTTDTLAISQSTTEHDMFLGQAGFRYFRSRGRFTYSSNFRAFFGASLQCSESNSFTAVRSYDVLDADDDGGEIEIGTAPEGIFTFDATDIFREDNEEFTVGFDLRGQLGYQVTRMLKVNVGVDLLYIGTGVWRGGTTFGTNRDQDLVMVGGSFGLSLNH